MNIKRYEARTGPGPRGADYYLEEDGDGPLCRAYDVEELEQRIKQLEAERDAMFLRVGRLVLWSHCYGEELCPGSRPDTFGEGMRAAKEAVCVILEAGGEAFQA